MDSYVFVVLQHDYADEFDVFGCTAMLEDRWNEIYAKIERGFSNSILTGDEFYFGTNEALTFETFHDFAKGANVTTCSKAFHDEFNALNRYPVGHWVVDQMLDRLAEETEE